MVPKKPNYRIDVNFLDGAADLKKHVFINVRKQTRQEMESVSASHL